MTFRSGRQPRPFRPSRSQIVTLDARTVARAALEDPLASVTLKAVVRDDT